ncbi:MAG TPA: hypothetical protein QGH10_11070, partial [Armatimonadota bacterium]|nr:hypothetical protein [Armatimonadota bacterium]
MRTMQPDARCALLALAFVAGSSVNAADIAFVNGGFELTDVGPDGVPVGWMLDALTPPERVGVDALRVHAGARAFRITDEQPDKGYAIHSDFYPAVPGETYRTTARVYNGIGDGWLYLEFYADPRNRVAETHAGCLKEGAWEQIVIEQPCPPEARYVVALLYSSGANVGQSSWDDVTLEGPQGEGEILSRDRNEAPKVDYSYLYDVGDSKQLLFDDAFLESHEGFWWRVCPPRKTGERNVVADRPWEDFIVNAWCTVMEDGGRYRMWYEAYDKSYKSDYDARYCYAESDDGIHWEKPSLGLVEFDGSKDNNILFGKLDGAAVHGGTVFMDPTASAEERYKFFFLSDGAIWAGLSPDGIHWTRRADG